MCIRASPYSASGRFDAAGPGAAAAAADIVEADDEETRGIDRFARTDAVVPPAGFAIPGGVDPRGMMIAAQRMAHQLSLIHISEPPRPY